MSRSSNAIPDVDDWLYDFVVRYRRLYNPFDWPAAGTDDEVVFIGLWSKAFRDNNVLQSEAISAAESLYETPPKYRSDHLPAVLREVRDARAKRSAAYRIYQPEYPTVPAADRFVWPEHLKRGDIVGLCEYLSGPGRKGRGAG